MYLLFLTVQDFRNNMMVDDRKNWFMMGLSISLYSHVINSVWYILSLLIMVLALNYLFKKYNVMGEADINSVTWMFLGFGIIGVFDLTTFAIIFCVILLFYTVLKNHVLKIQGKFPFYFVLLLCFGLSCWLTGVYQLGWFFRIVQGVYYVAVICLIVLLSVYTGFMFGSQITILRHAVEDDVSDLEFLHAAADRFADSHNFSKSYKCKNYSRDFKRVMNHFGYDVELRDGWHNNSNGHLWNALMVDVEPQSGDFRDGNADFYSKTLSEVLG